MELNRGTLASWFNTCTEEDMQPVYDRLHVYLLEQEIIHADETTAHVLHEDGKTPESKSYIWLYTSGAFDKHRIEIYEYQLTGGGYHEAKFIADYHGYVHTDGFSGYNSLKDVTRCGCWAHLRRYMFEAVPKGTKDTTQSPALTGLAYCDRLFEIERELADFTPDERKQKRLESERPLLDSFWEWVEKQNLLGGSKFSKAVNYALNQKPYIENYLKDGRYSISNNAAE